MEARTIDILSALDPASEVPKIPTGCAFTNFEGSALHRATSERFISQYCRVNFGWYIASRFAYAGERFPIPMMGRDQWVFRAYLMLVDPWSNFDENVAAAYHMAHYIKGFPDFGSTLKALIMSVPAHETVSSHLRAVSVRTGIPYKVLDAFESLFYNILDRREDGIYLQTEVYPISRMVEMSEGYIENTPMGDILKRAGYNYRDLDFTSYLAGMGDRSYMAKIAASEDRESELTKHIIGNGLLLTRTNLLNQRSVGISRAQTLLVASRQSGNSSEEPTMGGVAPLFSSAFATAIGVSRSATVDQLRKDAGVVDV